MATTTTTTTTAPRVYVGTYAKYNSGNLSGAWIDLTSCDNYEAFLRQCAAVHKDERHPEFMIQDCDNFPDGLSCMEWLDKCEFDDIKAALTASDDEDNTDNDNEPEKPNISVIDYSEKALAVVGDTYAIKDTLKRLGGRFNARLSCGAGWIFSKRQRSEIEHLLTGCATHTKVATDAPKEDKSKETLSEYLHSGKCPNVDYYKGENVGAVRANGGYILIPKFSIENKFCFHDEGPDYEHYKDVTRTDEALRKYFIAKNLGGIERIITLLQSSKELVLTAPNDYNNSVYFEERGYWSEKLPTMPDDVRAQLIEAYTIAKAQFEKRLNTYLKRYGTSKIHTWTYWADR